MAKDLEAVKVRAVQYIHLNYPGFSDNSPGKIEIINKGNYANATILRYTGNNLDIIIKDFSESPWIIRTFLGRFFIFKEARSLKRLKDLHSFPVNTLVISPYTLVYDYIDGKIIAHYRNNKLAKEFFLKLEELVHQMHRKGIAHMDLRCYGNIIVGKDGNPYIIDLQSTANIKWMPHIIQRYFKSSDLSGVYKCWKIACSEPLDQERERVLIKFNRMKKFWILRGYPSKYFQKKLRAVEMSK